MAAIDPLTEQYKDHGIASRILSLAYELSCHLPAELGVLNAFEPVPLGMLASGPEQDDYQSYRARTREQHEIALKGVLEEFRAANFNVHLHEGAADAGIAGTAEQESVDVMLIGAVSHSGMDRILVGSTAERVLEKINCDVLVVK